LDDAFAVKVCLLAPLLYISLAMIIDPPGVAAALQNFPRGLRNAIHGQRHMALHSPATTPSSAVRLTGLVLFVLILYSAS
jgi:hypothetical protein